MQVINKKIIVIFICLSIFIFGLFKLFNKEKIELDDVKLDIRDTNNSFAIYIEQSDGNYEESDNNVFPLEDYVYNKTLSGCLDSNSNEVEDALIYNYVSKELNLRVNKPVTCYVYFDKQEEKEFNYTGSYEEFIVPKSGEYQIELWGAGGGDKIEYEGAGTKEETAGRGAYTKGILKLNKNDKLYFFIGENPTEYGGSATTSIFNGGGYGEAPGGGATDVRLYIDTNGNWDDFDSLKTRIMVAAGGGGGAYAISINYAMSYQRGDGGTLTGKDAKFYASGSFNSYDYSGHGGTQTSGGQPGTKFSSDIDPKYIVEMIGKFGSGGYGINAKGNYKYTSSGGGGGYYGGGHGNHPFSTWTGGGGGSSFISGYQGCIAIDASSTVNNITPKSGCNSETQDITCSYHYSGKVFTNPVMFAGNEEMPTYDGEGTMIGNTGDGHAKIKLIVGG